MSAKKPIGNFYKHEDFMLMKVVNFKSTFTGFAVNTNVKILPSDHVTDNFRTDFLCIILVRHGSIKFKLNLEEYTLSANDMLAISPHTLKQLVTADEDATIDVLTFTADFIAKAGLPENVIEIMNYFSTRFSPIWSLKKEDAQLLTNLLGQLEHRSVSLATHPYGKELLHHSFFILLYELAALSKEYGKAVTPQSSRKETLVMSFTNLVQLNFIHQRNVSQYADMLFVTPKYLTETVKEIIGKNAGEIIDHFVILEAKLLLDNPKLSIAQVAEALNFSDQSFFGKYFKRHVGSSPKEYRTTNNIMQG